MADALAGTFTAIFSGTTLIESHFVNSWKPTFERLTPIAQRQNLWSSSVIVDGRYPAQLWTHEFVIYTEATSLSLFAEKFVNLDDKITGTAQQLTIQEDGVDRYNLGSCLLDSVGQDDPTELLLFRAGFLQLRFLGNTKPLLL